VVAPAPANATGTRFRPDLIYKPIFEKHGAEG
jgi:hypothetical protein